MNKESSKLNEYLTYNWFDASHSDFEKTPLHLSSSLRSNDDQESFWSEYAGSTMQKHWICPYCNDDILVTVAERVAHENQCQLNCKYPMRETITRELSSSIRVEKTENEETFGAKY